MLLYIVRHGDPIYETDSLTERGKLQAEAVGKRIYDSKIDRIFSSPMGRAMETAEPACNLLGIEKSIELDIRTKFDAKLKKIIIGELSSIISNLPQVVFEDLYNNIDVIMLTSNKYDHNAGYHKQFNPKTLDYKEGIELNLNISEDGWIHTDIKKTLVHEIGHGVDASIEGYLTIGHFNKNNETKKFDEARIKLNNFVQKVKQDPDIQNDFVLYLKALPFAKEIGSWTEKDLEDIKEDDINTITTELNNLIKAYQEELKDFSDTSIDLNRLLQDFINSINKAEDYTKVTEIYNNFESNLRSIDKNVLEGAGLYNCHLEGFENCINKAIKLKKLMYRKVVITKLNKHTGFKDFKIGLKDKQIHDIKQKEAVYYALKNSMEFFAEYYTYINNDKICLSTNLFDYLDNKNYEGWNDIKEILNNIRDYSNTITDNFIKAKNDVINNFEEANKNEDENSKKLIDEISGTDLYNKVTNKIGADGVLEHLRKYKGATPNDYFKQWNDTVMNWNTIPNYENDLGNLLKALRNDPDLKQIIYDVVNESNNDSK